MDDQQIEREIQAKGLTAPRVTTADIEANIASEHYFTAYGGAKWGRVTRDEPKNSDALKLLTFCVLVLGNGFTVTGESACVSPENFDPELGRKIARQNAIDKLWPLMGYALRDRLAAAGTKTNAARDVLAERRRQIEAEGWSPEHDDRHSAGQLAGAAGCYARHVNARGWVIDTPFDNYTTEPAPMEWPWADSWWKPTTPRRDLVKAGALILAEIERLDRAADDHQHP
jgi:hypothetical protein